MPKPNPAIKFPAAIEGLKLKSKTVGEDSIKVISFNVVTTYSKALHALLGELCGQVAVVELGAHQAELTSPVDSKTGEALE